ncbi:Latent-transforming growth factor beta-binding protein 2 [Collichthys lucidus]|uniref:Latent-transforming growth factor beta-binding protein 2 n=1 Tax=Collichthys lucidus TaxID=240159 RepID=A0A4U5VEA0_COLLU|nr:Latent-transforming growth factor beta-binding protein 2 [Collichthys lucidus]
MDRAGFAVLMFLTVALVRIGDSRRDTAGGRKEGAGAGRAVWDQQQSRVKSQGHSPRGPEDGASSRPAGETSPASSSSRILVRLPRGTSSQGGGRHTSTAGAPRKDLVSAPRDGALRTARQAATQQHRTKVNRRQSSKPSSASTRRLVGPNVCGGQQCCSGWALAPGTNRCIKPQRQGPETTQTGSDGVYSGLHVGHMSLTCPLYCQHTQHVCLVSVLRLKTDHKSQDGDISHADCQPPCQNRGSCSRPHTCVCRSGFQGPRCEEVAPEQVYIRDGGGLRRVQPGSNPFQRDQPRRRPSERQAIDTTKVQTPRPATTRQPVPEGTKDHRELSTQRGTDMSFSLSIATLQSPIRNKLSEPQCQRAWRPQPNPSHQEGLCRCSCWRDKFCILILAPEPQQPHCFASIQKQAFLDLLELKNLTLRMLRTPCFPVSHPIPGIRPGDSGSGSAAVSYRRCLSSFEKDDTGTSRTVKRYPSSSGPITSNALPSGNGYANSRGGEQRNWHGHRNGHSNVHSFNTHRPSSDSQLHGQFNNVLPPAGANLTSNLDRIKIVFTPMLCRRVCNGGRCYNSCEKGDITTVYSETSQHQQQQPKNQGFRLYINECLLPGICKNAECLNTKGSYRCMCKPGFMLDPESKHCVYHFKEICPAGHGYTYSLSDVQFSVRHLGEDDLQSTARQRDTKTARRCGNSEPETSPDSSIIDLTPDLTHTHSVTGIDKCATTPTICGHGKCIPVQTGYTCQCEPGFKLSALQTNCIDVNECDEDPCEGKGRCINNYGSYSCHCYSGYSQVITQNRKFCQDINECSMPHKCQNGKCVNTEGSYTCECNGGYAKSWRDLCEDVDECRDPSSCPNGVCVNTLGSFQCQGCGPGFRPADDRCVDVNECLNQTVCGRGRCVNTEGSYWCNCFQGYKLSLDNVCQDVDECVLPGVCLHGRCVNLDGTHKCTCNHGYQVTSDSKDCEDVNECETGNVCPAGICINTAGSYTCQNCRPGFGPSADGLRCEDVNECSQGDLCLGGVCANTEGSYTCTRCKAGYRVSQDRQRCEDIDECQSPSTCANGICLNSEGSYTCENCPTGYRVSYDGELCDDIDECALPTTCPQGTCTNTAGSYACIICQPGFRVSEDGQQCDDVDECLLANMCPGQLCLNTPGSYTCRSCGVGLQLSEDGYGCEDIDECQTPGVCPTGVCTNIEGSFTCMACDPGFTVAPNGLSCDDINECLTMGICGEGNCLNTEGSYTCICPKGYTTIDGRPGCQGTVTNCRKSTNSNGKLFFAFYGLRVIGCGSVKIGESSFRSMGLTVLGQGHSSTEALALGQPRYRLQAQSKLPGPASDVDECSKDNVCIRGRCVNTDGSFLCLCEIGFKYNADTADCEDIDECVNETICGNHGFCENTDGSFRCQCDQGYNNPPGDMSKCVDVNECEMSQALCGEALCENFDGSFLCICPNDNEEFDPITSHCRSLADITPEPAPRVPPFSPSAEERKECYYNLNDANFCDNVLSRNVTKQECCCTVGAGWGDNCEIHACPVPGRDDYNQLCPHGSGLLSFPVSSTPGLGEQRPYIDANECEMFGADICKNGQCSNLFSSYTCYCRSGFYYDNIRLECVDYDECGFGNACENGECVNTAGSFNCFCSPPLVLDSTRRRCISLNTTEESPEPDHDVHMEICWQRLEGDNMCSGPLQGRVTTYTECCCLFGVAWSEQCAFCPRRDSGEKQDAHKTYCLITPVSILNCNNIKNITLFCVLLYLEDYAVMCNLARRGGSDSLRERPGYEYGLEGPEDPVGPFVPPYFDTYGNPAGPYDIPESVPLFNDNDYSVQHPRVRVPIQRPQERQPQPVSPYSERYEGFEGLRAEECGILNGCENGRCVRVREGYTCDCFDGYEFDLNKMACIDINECEDISDKVPLCQNGQCTNTEGSYKCTCLPGFVASAKPHQCIPAIPESELGETEN